MTEVHRGLIDSSWNTLINSSRIYSSKSRSQLQYTGISTSVYSNELDTLSISCNSENGGDVVIYQWVEWLREFVSEKAEEIEQFGEVAQ